MKKRTDSCNCSRYLIGQDTYVRIHKAKTSRLHLFRFKLNHELEVRVKIGGEGSRIMPLPLDDQVSELTSRMGVQTAPE